MDVVAGAGGDDDERGKRSDEKKGRMTEEKRAIKGEPYPTPHTDAFTKCLAEEESEVCRSTYRPMGARWFIWSA